ncbi:sulfite exporter TauE/SafE family protein [Mucilaginibacter polytrichastri]|uniref:Urease accessory protein UreH-like transmembrane domain-containing protein n=1 Tax=Mucilaginibacter polytrichastri TaxID=1302689 RepID=A0A1Q6A0L1_9SPHI|nr:sulfite exporter TauE/SafE family protein [Mucilaginibacter polytrichastri]OKS87521.1 hypothetical protein RG47T_2982 [Mucilaginibacter polytrichastri]SFS91658.1 hypothetical protein SAMN04487890_106116 [Mucilaginibacter polytrichastri]
MNANELAFFIGLFGSIHCIGMCGPLAFAIPNNYAGFMLIIWDKLIYNLGRVLSYATLGLVTGLIGRQIWLSGLQQGVSVFSGVLIILAASSRFLKVSIANNRLGSVLIKPFNKVLTYALKHRAGHLIIGVLNGFLPCGFVYLALIGAVNASTVMASVSYMACFGLGTIPLMLVASVSTGLLNNSVRRKMNKVVPYFMLCLGVWFVLRGLSLNIPYISPAANTGKVICR